jgi:deazaflavin-dependent oxidoreductase (nitroreductase family)
MSAVKDRAFKLGTGFHRAVFRATKGRVGGRGFGMPVLILTTTGRKSGEPRETMLTTPVHDDERIVLVASFGGDDRNPAWFHNLRAHPEVEVLMHGRTERRTARVAGAEEKAELWPQVVDAYRGYAGYQRRTDRDIPLVLLERPGTA